MAKNDLSKMSRGDLVKLKGEVDKAIASLEKRKKAEAKKAAEAAAKKHGFSLGELVGGAKGRKAGLPAKFRNPDNPKQTWSGRGRQPAWYKSGIAKGKKPADFAI